MILVDTSIWVDYFRGRSSEKTENLETILVAKRVAITGIIEAELYFGAKSKKLKDALENALDPIFRIYEEPKLWKTVGENGSFLKSKGVTIPLSDLIIGTLAIENNLSLLHNDSHYDLIAKFLKLKVV